MCGGPNSRQIAVLSTFVTSSQNTDLPASLDQGVREIPQGALERWLEYQASKESRRYHSEEALL
jgi:hypothetical protein